MARTDTVLSNFENNNFPFQTIKVEAFEGYCKTLALLDEKYKEPIVTVKQIQYVFRYKKYWVEAFEKNESEPFYRLLKHPFIHPRPHKC